MHFFFFCKQSNSLRVRLKHKAGHRFVPRVHGYGYLHQITPWLIHDRRGNRELVNRLEHRFRHGWILQVRSWVAKDYWILGQR